MTRRGERADHISAAELMSQLSEDDEFQKLTGSREAELRVKVDRWREAERPIVDELREVGIEVASVWDLVNTSDPYPMALSVLIKHLERGGYPDRVLEGVARALAVQPACVYWERLRTLYIRATGPDSTEGLAVALAAAATANDLDDLLELLHEKSRGTSRIHFIRSILRVGGLRGRHAVEQLQSDPVFGQEATALLSGKTW